jgi:hypothetical protein
MCQDMNEANKFIQKIKLQSCHIINKFVCEQSAMCAKIMRKRERDEYKTMEVREVNDGENHPTGRPKTTKNIIIVQQQHVRVSKSIIITYYKTYCL